MKTVSVITLHNVHNYGSALQTLATQEVFEKLGCKVDFIDFRREEQCSYLKMMRSWFASLNLVKGVINAITFFPSYLKHEQIFKDFLSRRIHLQQKPYITPEDFKHFPIESDIYCTGSDQTWNSGWNGGIIGALFLDFVPDNVKKIAYSASFGKTRLDDWEKGETRRLLNRYAAISVRENSGVSICENLGILGVEHVLDPTLQLDRNYWLKQIKSRRIRDPYVLVYQLNPNSDFDRYAKEFARRKRLRLVRFCWCYNQIIKGGKPIVIPPVEDFISAINYADCVITDSFHATAFSINMNTDFISVYPHEYGGRIESILRQTRLEDRHLKDYEDFSFVNQPHVDFSEANQILEKEREKGWAFLKDAIK